MLPLFRYAIYAAIYATPPMLLPPYDMRPMPLMLPLHIAAPRCCYALCHAKIFRRYLPFSFHADTPLFIPRHAYACLIADTLLDGIRERDAAQRDVTSRACEPRYADDGAARRALRRHAAQRAPCAMPPCHAAKRLFALVCLSYLRRCHATPPLLPH